MSNTDRVKLPGTKLSFCPSSAVRRTMMDGAKSESIRRKVADSEVIESIEQVHHNPLPHTIDQPQHLKEEHDVESSDDNANFEKADASKSNQMNDHNFFQKCNFRTFGSANTKVHSHPKGLTQVFFSNCVVKVRRGHDLDKMVTLSRIGPIKLCNIQSSGWIASDESLLPAFLFLRWMSSME